MKLLFPIFASLMLQHQVNTEFWNVQKCLMGYGKCKKFCGEEEKEIQKCKKKKCCIGPKVIKLIKIYLRHEIPHIPELDNETMLSNYKNLNVKQNISSIPPNINSTSPFSRNNPVSITNATTVNARAFHTRTPGHIIHTSPSTKRDTTQSRESASVSPPPPPP